VAALRDQLADLRDQPAPMPSVRVRAAGGAPAMDPPPGHVPGLARRDIRPPSWWKGDRAAFRSTVQAGRELGEPAARSA